MKTTDYCSYELSKELKVCGFDEPCDHYFAYDEESKIKHLLISASPSEWDWNHSALPEFVHPECSAPQIYHAQKWLREKMEVCVTVYAQPYNGLPYYTGYILFNGDEKEVLDQDGHWFDDYEKCLSETIAAALELITKGE